MSNNYKEDTEEGNKTFALFISKEKSNKRLKQGSSFYEVLIDKRLVGIYELEENHLTLLYVDNDFQKKGIGSLCLENIKLALREKYSELTVFASPYSLSFYTKNGFLKLSKSCKSISGINYFPMSLNID